MATKGSNTDEWKESGDTDIPVTSSRNEPKKIQSEQRANDSSMSITTSTASTEGYEEIPKTSLLDNSGMSSHQLNESILQEAKAKIARAEEDRRKSRLPKRLVPLVEMCLPPDYRLSQFEEDAGKTYQKIFGSCTPSACLGNIDDGGKHNDAHRRDEDGELFDKTVV
mmetsp:Transcript_18002/g.39357  ORF Transcript_18002/g.39357 Transcript_18002/m.39357 type:complete len:167 (-) Transcript_18002:30-530(-)